MARKKHDKSYEVVHKERMKSVQRKLKEISRLLGEHFKLHVPGPVDVINLSIYDDKLKEILEEIKHDQKL